MLIHSVRTVRIFKLRFGMQTDALMCAIVYIIKCSHTQTYF